MLGLFHPYTTWVQDKSWLCFLTRLLVALAVPGLVRMIRGGRPPAGAGGLMSETTPRGIVDLELAGSRSWADRIMDAWGPPRWRSAIIGLYLDFLFILLYTNVLAIAVVCSSLSWKPTLGWLSTTGVVIAWLQWAAGGFDVVENVLLLRMLRQRERHQRNRSHWVPRIATLCAVLKFGLVWLGVLYALSFPVVNVLES